MLIWTKCKKELRCETNGINARWNGTHIYPGDLFKCPVCGIEILNTGSTNAYHNEDHKRADIYMDNSYEYYTTKKFNLRK